MKQSEFAEILKIADKLHRLIRGMYPKERRALMRACHELLHELDLHEDDPMEES